MTPDQFLAWCAGLTIDQLRGLLAVLANVIEARVRPFELPMVPAYGFPDKYGPPVVGADEEPE